MRMVGKNTLRKLLNTAVGKAMMAGGMPRIFQETIEQYQARVANRCEAGKDLCALRILEAQGDFRGEVSLLEFLIFCEKFMLSASLG
jgi:hypothetical protein